MYGVDILIDATDPVRLTRIRMCGDAPLWLNHAVSATPRVQRCVVERDGYMTRYVVWDDISEVCSYFFHTHEIKDNEGRFNGL